tara:strand:+ start:639 stop:818 length:180 start_codon:yes stop_codon:yes gene_type:complete
MKGRIMSEITGMLAIGTGEKCPYCDRIITKDFDVFKHMTERHKDEMTNALFGTNKTERK